MTTCQCGKPTSGAQFCEDCNKTFRYALANVAAYYDDLGNVERKQTRYSNSGQSKGSVGRTIPAPVDMRFAGIKAIGNQLKYDTWRTVAEWTKEVMKVNPRRSGPTCGACLHVTCSAIRRSRWPRNTVPSEINYLARHFGYITSQNWAPAMYDEFLDLEHRLGRIVNKPADKWYAGRCGFIDENDETCETELYATSSKGTITCRGCNIQHDVAERREVLLREAKEYLVTATEAAAALLAWTDYNGSETKLVDRIRKWRDRGRLDVADVTSLNGRDRHLYRLGDIQDLLIGDAQNAQEKHVRDGVA